jgi:hypothetical protein
MLETVGRLHLGVIRAAFQCDLLRVATFQWASAYDHVAFKGLFPGEPDTAYRHHAMTSPITQGDYYQVAPPTNPQELGIVEFLTNVNLWLNQKTADILSEFKSATDAYGCPLLDYTVVPYFTELGNATRAQKPLAAMILGGRALGLQGGQFQNFEAAPRAYTDFWLTIAQAFFPDAGNVLESLSTEKFAQDPTKFTGPIEGLWVKP